jgi:pimeloyl-ACP methyl ester carboxylesterase
MSRILADAGCELIDDAYEGAPWLVLVHGTGQDRRVFDTQVDAFCGDHRLCLIDLPGHGLARAYPGPFGLAEHADAVARALDAAGIEWAHYWGTHTGAAAGLVVACRQPDRFGNLVLEGPVIPGRPMPAVTELTERIAATLRRDGIAAARDQWWREGEWFAVMRAEPDRCRAAAQRAMLDDFDGPPWLGGGPLANPLPPLDAALARLEMPVLIVNGAADLPEFLAAAAELARLIPKATRLTVPGAGGFPLWEAPRYVNQEVGNFIAPD